MLILALRPSVERMVWWQRADALQIPSYKGALSKIMPLTVGTNLLVTARTARRGLLTNDADASGCRGMVTAGQLGW